MRRREALKAIGLVLGAPVSPALARVVLAGVRAPAGQDPRTLSPAQNELLGVLVERIIPTTDTPGAREAGVPMFIDTLLSDIFTDEDRQRFLGALAGVDRRARERTGVPFVDGTPDQQVALLNALERDAGTDGDAQAFFPWLKELTLVGYYTSEIGASQELRYVHVAGRYDGDVPYDQVGRAYS